MKTGIIILNYNDLKNTESMLVQIKDYEVLHKIIVVDNCSTDNSYRSLKKYNSDKIVVIKAKENKGYASGNNVGLEYLEKNTDCDLVIISNPDVLVTEDTIKKLVKDFNNEDISFLGPKVNELGRISRGWKIPGFWNDLGANIPFFYKYFAKYLLYPEEYYQNDLTKVGAIHGCFFMARLKDFKKIGYFDSNTFLYYEENIIGKKALENNLGIYVDLSVEVKHCLSKSVDKSLKKVQKYKYLKESQTYYEKEYCHLNILGRVVLKISYYLSLGWAYLTYWL